MSLTTSNKRPHPTSSTSQSSKATPSSTSTISTYLNHPIYFTPSPIHDRSSTFTAIFSPSPFFLTNPQHLQRHPSLTPASHKILAWRRQLKKSQSTLPFTSSSSSTSSIKPTTQITTYETGSDDDGEKYAGSKLEKLLEREGVEGVVVVGRWWGGVMLGPVRFKWIEDVAGEAIGVWRRSDDDDTSGGGGKRRRVVDGDDQDQDQDHVEEEKREKQRLVRVLKERDGSVDVLRGLLGDKNRELEGWDENRGNKGDVVEKVVEENPKNVEPSNLAKDNDGGDDDDTIRQKQQQQPDEQKPKDEANVEVNCNDMTQPQHTQSSSSAEIIKPKPSPIDYESMPVQRLKQLEKARDATLAWILKQIDAVEVKLKEKERKRAS